MAKRDDKPKTHAIAPSSGARCASCGKPIARGELAFDEVFISADGKWARGHQYARTARRTEFSDDDRGGYQDLTNPDLAVRPHHLACAAQHQAYKLRSALATTLHDIPGRAELERAIERSTATVDAAEANEETRARYQELLAQLRDGDDGDELLVFGDWLQQVGDPRGELMAIQRGLETATGEDKTKLADREKKLLAVHRTVLTPEHLDATCTWHRGFVKTLTLHSAGSRALGPPFQHPSFALLRELVVAFSPYSSLVAAANIPGPLPETVRTLSITADRIGDPAPLVAQLPQLGRLHLHGAAELAGLAHPTLPELELQVADASQGTEMETLVDRISKLEKRRLPKLARVILRIPRGLGAAAYALANTTLAKQVKVIAHGPISETERAQLAAKQLVVEDPPAPPAPAPPPTTFAQPSEWRVRHTRKPQWGEGRVIEETDEGVRVAFEQGGEQFVKNVELLEDIER